MVAALLRLRAGGDLGRSSLPICFATKARPCGLSNSLFWRISCASKSFSTLRTVARVRVRLPVVPGSERTFTRVILLGING
eukprot:5468358-Pleurochrysis_carterae.AAC.2